MNNQDKNQIIERYHKRLATYGENINALASGSVDRREIRFRIMSSIDNLTTKKILDLGCGFADYYKWLVDRGVKVDYTGYDITPELVDKCISRFPDCKFEVRDIQQEGIAEKFDYIFSSQAFNNKLSFESNVDTVKDIIRICYESCNEGLAIDLLSSYVDYREDHLFYYSPEEMFAFSKGITKKVCLRHDYPAYEFALFLYKDFQGWNR